MSVVVRMEMPNGCHDCKLRNMIGNCPIPMFDGLDDEEKIWTLAECFQRPPWCPIICSLPEGHGPLVDSEEDASKYITVWDCNCSEFGRQTVMAVEDLQYLPIIVPAERSEA